MSKSIECAYQFFRGLRNNRAYQFERTHQEFPQFLMLSEDIVVEILSFVSYGPLEFPNNKSGTLTHIFPFVSRQFRAICHNSEILWLQTLVRLLRQDPEKWKPSLLSIVKAEKSLPPWSCFYDPGVDKDNFMLAVTVAKMHQFNQKQMIDLLKRVYNTINASDDLVSKKNLGLEHRSPCVNKQLYSTLVAKYMVTTLPILHVPFQVNMKIVCKIQLHLNKHMDFLEEITKHRNYVEINKGPFQKPRPRFLLSTSKYDKLVPGVTLYIVELRKCTWNPDGTAQISIELIEKRRLMRVTKQDGEGFIYYGHVRC